MIKSSGESDLAIRVRGVGKKYVITRSRQDESTLAETVLKKLKGSSNGGSGGGGGREEFWALKDLEFDIAQGDVVGVIGRNGAGKSTLLKVLSRITEPTAGEIEMYGRVGSLLEVGTGFHPELTGRENIYLNGAILGMNRGEIRRQFDAIVDFAGVDKFLDTPVKRYSSGMYVRLAFAVAAHLETEILIVDEVLAVGDAEFQRKCLGKMKDVASGGRTVLFVSHHMQSVRVLCNRAMYLERGKCLYYGEIAGAIDLYTRSFERSANKVNADIDRRPGTGEYRFVEVTADRDVFDPAGVKSVSFTIERRHHVVGNMYVSGHVVDEAGNTLVQFDSRLVNGWWPDSPRMTGRLTFDKPWLKPGKYFLDMFICANGVVDRFERACRFDVSPVLPYPQTSSSDGMAYGLVLGEYQWDLRPE